LANPSIITIAISTVTDAYLDHVRARQSKSSYEDKKRAFKLLYRHVDPTRPIIEVSYLIIEQVLAEAAKTSNNRANRHRTHFLACWNWAVRAFGLPKDSPWDVDPYPHTAIPHRMPTGDEFWKVVNAADEQHQAILLTFLFTAGRKGEVLRLRWCDVDFEHGTITLYTSKRKGGAPQADRLAMIPALRDVLKKQQARTRLRSEYVFINEATGSRYTSATKMMEQLCRNAGVEKFGFHGIRHLAATVLADAPNMSLKDVQRMLRHKQVATTERYIHSLGCRLDERAAEAFERFSGGPPGGQKKTGS